MEKDRKIEIGIAAIGVIVTAIAAYIYYRGQNAANAQTADLQAQLADNYETGLQDGSGGSGGGGFVSGGSGDIPAFDPSGGGILGAGGGSSGGGASVIGTGGAGNGVASTLSPGDTGTVYLGNGLWAVNGLAEPGAAPPGYVSSAGAAQDDSHGQAAQTATALAGGNAPPATVTPIQLSGNVPDTSGVTVTDTRQVNTVPDNQTIRDTFAANPNPGPTVGDPRTVQGPVTIAAPTPSSGSGQTPGFGGLPAAPPSGNPGFGAPTPTGGGGFMAGVASGLLGNPGAPPATVAPVATPIFQAPPVVTTPVEPTPPPRQAAGNPITIGSPSPVKSNVQLPTGGSRGVAGGIIRGLI